MSTSILAETVYSSLVLFYYDFKVNVDVEYSWFSLSIPGRVVTLYCARSKAGLLKY